MLKFLLLSFSSSLVSLSFISFEESFALLNAPILIGFYCGFPQASTWSASIYTFCMKASSHTLVCSSFATCSSYNNQNSQFHSSRGAFMDFILACNNMLYMPSMFQLMHNLYVLAHLQIIPSLVYLVAFVVSNKSIEII